MTDVLLTTDEAAAYSGMSRPFLEKRRMRGESPLYIKKGNRIFYTKKHLDEWTNSCIVYPKPKAP